MVETLLKVVKVFIASPSGLDDERLAAKRVVDEINQSHAEHWGCQIKLVGWEATLPGYSRAQSLINRDLDKCDYFVGVIWDNWGSKPEDGDSRYTSGFEEEFERAKDRVESGLMKDLALFFKDISEVQLKNLHASHKKVLAFRQRCERARKPLFRSFSKTNDFEPLLRATIEAIGWREAEERSIPPSETPDARQPASGDDEKAKASQAPDGLFEKASAAFVSDLLQRPSDWNATCPYEIARLRLIAIGTRRSGNDEIYLGNHDANLLFVNRHDFDFSVKEITALIDTGIAGFDNQHVPLWHWLSRRPYSTSDFRRVEILAAFGDQHEKVQAIRILQCAGMTTPVISDMVGRKDLIGIWLLGDLPEREIEAALSFLNTNGGKEDLSVVEGLLDKVALKHKHRVSGTIVHMTANQRLTHALDRLIEFDPDPLGPELVGRLFSHPESIATELLQQCLALKSDLVRRNACRTLHSRQAIDVATAERLMTDNDLG